MKLGLYRSPNIKKDSIIYFDEIRIGATLNDISMASRAAGLSNRSPDIPLLEGKHHEGDKEGKHRMVLSVEKHENRPSKTFSGDHDFQDELKIGNVPKKHFQGKLRRREERK